MPAPPPHWPDPEIGNDGPTTIVVGVDFSDSADRAFSYAAGVARRSGSRLIAAYVVGSSGLAETVGLTAGVTARQAGDCTEIEVELQDRVKKVACDIEVELRVLHGSPAEALARLASRLHADLLVVGTTHHARPLKRSIGEQLGRDAECPVVVIP